ncbi:MAG: hypothetical protein ACYDG2_00915 [Ruminiclostridium sp.]
MNYITSVDDLIDYIKALFYEQGFQDCSSISNMIKRGLSSISLRTLLELDIGKDNLSLADN